MIIESNHFPENTMEELKLLKECLHFHKLAVWEYHFKTRKIYFDDFDTNMFGYENEKIINLEDFVNITHPIERKYIFEDIHRNIINNVPFVRELRLKNKDGVYKWFSLSGKSLTFDTHRNPEKINGLLSDIDEIKIKTEALKESQKLAKMGRWDYYHKEHLLHWDEKVYEIFNLDPQHFIPTYEKFLELIHPEDRKNVDDAWKNSLITKKSYNIVHRIILKSGQIKWIKEFCSTEYKDSGEPQFSLGLVQDISELKIVEEELRINHQKLKTLLKKAEDQKESLYCLYKVSRRVLNSTDLKETIKLLFFGCEKYTSINSGYIVLYDDDGKEEEFIRIGDNDIPGAHHYCSPTASIKNDDKFIISSLKIEDQSIGFLVLEKKDKQIDDEVLKTIDTIAELLSMAIQKRKLMKKLHEEKEKAESANKVKNDFLAIMSHELRTPLNGIIGFSEILRQTRLDEEQSEYINIVIGSAKQLLNIISSILDFTKLESKNLKLYPEKIRFLNIIEDILRLIQDDALKKNLDINIDIPEDIPDYIEIDSLRLKQILIYLLSNAIKFTEKGFIELKIRNIGVDSAEQKVNLIFSVRDSGIGIKNEDQKIIFNKFHQIDMSMTRKYGGMGLGLAITNKLLEKMNSQLNLTSIYGQGSEFFFYLSVPFFKVKSISK